MTTATETYEGYTCTGCGCDVSPEDEASHGEWCAACHAKHWHACPTCGENHLIADLNDNLECPI